MSVDGTVDVERCEAYAHESSKEAQRVTCVKCQKSIPIWDAKEHVEYCKRGAAAGRGRKKLSGGGGGPFARYNNSGLQSVLY